MRSPETGIGCERPDRETCTSPVAHAGALSGEARREERGVQYAESRWNGLVPLILLNKPYRVLSQFTNDGTRWTLADYVPV
jgi:16S rRNA U516 pseudouridylate synthase RsuA-like enzyme